MGGGQGVLTPPPFSWTPPFSSVTINSHYKDLEHKVISRCIGQKVPKGYGTMLHQVMFWESGVKKVCMVFSYWFQAYHCRHMLSHIIPSDGQNARCSDLTTRVETVTETLHPNQTSFSLSSGVGSASVRPPP